MDGPWGVGCATTRFHQGHLWWSESHGQIRVGTWVSLKARRGVENDLVGVLT